MAEQKISKADARTMTTHLAKQALKAGVLYEAIEDFVRRGYDALGDAPDTYRVQEWVDSERVNAPHLFAAQERHGAGTPPVPSPTPQTTDYSAIKDSCHARLTLFREAQQKAAQGAQP